LDTKPDFVSFFYKTSVAAAARNIKNKDLNQWHGFCFKRVSQILIRAIVKTGPSSEEKEMALVMKKAAAALTAVAALSVAPAHATIATFFDDIFAGAATFDSIVTGAGGTVVTDTLSGLTSGATIYDRGDYTIEKANGAAMFPTTYTLYNSSPSTQMTGQAIDISPSSTDVDAAKSSGIVFTFDTGINALGFEVGDWATCCQPSNLYISFGAGAPILVGESTSEGDQYLTNGGAGVFVGAADDTSTFTQVTFWGNGLGEYLVAGGTVRYAAVDIGGLPPSGVPVPAPIALLGLGLLGLAWRGRKAA